MDEHYLFLLYGLYGSVLKWGYPQSSSIEKGFFLIKQTFLGYPHFCRTQRYYRTQRYVHKHVQLATTSQVG